MKYILIDTNCWVDLLSPENTKALSLLEYWTDVKKLVILVPEELMKEWERQKGINARSIIKVQNDALSKIKNYKNLLRLEQSNIEERVGLIDQLLAKGKFIKPGSKVLADVTRRYTQGKAPFHRKNNNSNSDALIYLTAVEFIRKNNLKEFVFTTRDADDFGSLTNPEKQLHPDLNIPGIKTEYIFNIGSAIKTLQLELGDLKDFFTPANNDYIPRFQLIPLSRNISLLDSVFNSLKKNSDQITFIPTDILARVWPFKIKHPVHTYTYHSSFTIHSNNKELVELFRAIECRKKRIENEDQADFGLDKTANRKKANYVVQRLTQNLVYDIRATDHSVSADLRFVKDRFCSCVLCSYNKYDFVSALKNLSEVPLPDDLETMKHAYVHFQFGDFSKSLQFFHHVYKRGIQERKILKSFICLYNLKLIKTYIEGFYTQKDSEILKIIGEIDKLSLNELELSASPDPFLQAVIRWILYTDFYNSPFKEISNTIEKIRSHYENQIRGGFGSNSNFNIILGQFAEIECFLDHNCIIWNHYSDFEDLANKFVEGMLTIHSFNEDQEQRLPYIDDSLLILVSRFVNRENIVKYYNRVHLSAIKFKHESRTEPSLEETLLKLLHDYKTFKALYDQKKSAKMFLWDKYKKIFSNLLLFVTVSDSRTTQYDKIFDALLDNIEDETFFRKFDDKVLAEFINAKGIYFKTASLQKFLKLAIKTPKLHEHRIFYCLQKIILAHHADLRISDRRIYKIMLKNFFHECPKCKTFHHSDILSQVFPLLTETLQSDLRKKFQMLLAKKFDPEVYYTAAIYEIIDYHSLFDQYVSVIKPIVLTEEIRNPFNRNATQFPRLNEILNLAFKFNIDLNRKEFEKYRGISDYYDWLLNMDDFDYSRFNPLWILAYKTDIYLNKIFDHVKTKAYLQKWLRKTNHPHITELFIKYAK